MDVPTDATLAWTPGADAVSHDVYPSAEEQAVVAGTAPVGRGSENRHAVDTLNLDTRYYWKVMEVNAAEPVGAWESGVWTFTTRDSYVVDDFETYNDNEEAGLAIWQTWVDGYDSTDNGSQVGHNPAPYAERTTVHQGRQSMPFYYSNEGTARFSEAVRTFEDGQDWTRGGAKALVLYFHGAAENTVGQL